MNDFLNILVSPLRILLDLLYAVFHNYAWAIFVFTVIINLIMFPLNIKQQKTTAKQALLKPKLDALKEKFGNDKMKYNTEMNALYQREGVNPAGGCLPLLIRMPILLGVYQVVLQLVENKSLNFNFFGIDLSIKPEFSTDIINGFQLIWLIPLLSFATAMISSLVTMSVTKKTNPQAGSSMNFMMLLMPLMSLWIAFSVIGAVGFYWACSNVVLTVIQLIINRFYSMDSLNAKELLEKGANRRKSESKKIGETSI